MVAHVVSTKLEKVTYDKLQEECEKRASYTSLFLRDLILKFFNEEDQLKQLTTQIDALKLELSKKPKEVIKEVSKEVIPQTPCAKCGKLMEWTLKEFRNAVKDYSHSSCLK